MENQRCVPWMGDATRKPDVSCWFNKSQFDWRHLTTFAEVKNCGGKANEKSSYIETAGKASCLLYAQDGHHAVPCIRILSSRIYFKIFDCGRSLSTCSYDINCFPWEFLHILIGVSCAPNNTLRFDMSILWWEGCDGQPPSLKELKFMKDNITYIVKLTKVLFISDNINGWGTMVWQGCKTEASRRNRVSMQAPEVVWVKVWMWVGVITQTQQQQRTTKCASGGLPPWCPERMCWGEGEGIYTNRVMQTEMQDTPGVQEWWKTKGTGVWTLPKA